MACIYRCSTLSIPSDMLLVDQADQMLVDGYLDPTESFEEHLNFSCYPGLGVAVPLLVRCGLKVLH